VSGVEPGLQHAAWAREKFGFPVVNRLADLERGQFDVIALFHTLEHFRDPVAYIRELKTYLAPRGCFAVEVPNVDDALISVYKVPRFPEFYFQRAHLYYFSPDTLRRTFALAGGSAEVVGVQRYDLSNHMRWMLTGEPGGQSAYASIFPRSVNLAYSEALIDAGYADTLWAVARFDVDQPGC
jgi:SAM-dependent methyltransferase